jgi:alkylhydroperoxidase family enzyme
LGGFGQINSRGAGDRRGRYPDPRLDQLFTDPCFWVVSRGNNCHYCLGHQELKLRAGGLDDDTIAALDSDWSRFDPSQKAVLAFARKLTLEPALVADADVAKLREFFSDTQIIELAFAIGRFNSVNRWADGMGLPQERNDGDEGDSMFTTPTSQQFQRTKSIVVPATRAPRLPMPTLEQTRESIAACQVRLPRVALPREEDARQVLSSVIGDRAPWTWERALAELPENGKSHVAIWNTVQSDDHLTPRFKAELAFLTAINNHAWYAAAHAASRLTRLGVSPAELTALIRGEWQPTDGAAAAYRLAAKSTNEPHLITDADFAAVRDGFSDQEAAQILQVICLANMFDRFTEALGLPLEISVADDARQSLQ